jgi:hypothetical protein
MNNIPQHRNASDSAGKPNSQYNRAATDSLESRLIDRARRRMFVKFMESVVPEPLETVLDLGVTSDQSYTFSNYFEALYPWVPQVTAAGVDDARFLERLYPGLRFVFADALRLPFSDEAFDIVHSAAVMEHVGSFERQATMISECLRVAKRAVFVTTPNRWFPIEVHTQLPFVHWLPPRLSRAILRRIGYDFFADEANLNLVTRSGFVRILARHPEWHSRFVPMRLFGLTSNLLVVATRSRTGHGGD